MEIFVTCRLLIINIVDIYPFIQLMPTHKLLNVLGIEREFQQCSFKIIIH